MAQYMETTSEKEATDALRQLTIANHYQSHGTPAPSTASSQSCTWNCPGQVTDNESESMESDNGLFCPLFSCSSAPWLTFSGGVALSSSSDEIISPAMNLYPSRTHSVPSSSELSGLAERAMTQQEIQNWASTHNGLFLESLGASVSALNLTTTAQTLGFEYPGTTSSPSTSYIDYSGRYANGNSLTAPIPAPAFVQRPQYALAPIPHQFRPNNMVLKKRGHIDAQSAQRPTSGNYLGSRSSSSKAREVQGLPDHENCALFLTNIPVEATLQELFSTIKTGAVFCLHVNPPNSVHKTNAAKLAFMIPQAAAAFLAQINSINGIVLHGHRIQGRFNRNGYARNENPFQSRVLSLEGPTPMMTLEYWTSRFAEFSEFELECYRLYPSQNTGLRKMEFRFARIDGQAQTCLQAIVYDPTLTGVVHVKYGTDPCKP